MAPEDIAGLVLMLMGATILLWALPSCGDPRCVEAHRNHMVMQRAANIEKTHAIYHSPDRPQPLCSLCQARKRDDE